MWEFRFVVGRALGINPERLWIDEMTEQSCAGVGLDSFLALQEPTFNFSDASTLSGVPTWCLLLGYML